MSEKSAVRDTYTEAFAGYYQMVFNAVYTKVGNIADTEDICQEVFIALYRHIAEVENIRKWLYGTLKNAVLHYYRDKKYSKKEDVDELFQDVSLTFVNGFRDTRIIISEAIEESVKSEEDRMLVDLIAFHNYSYSETAKLMGFTKRRVEYRYTQIAKEILRRLNERGIKNIEDIL
jgi:RNA polymerase sigma-70 factor (ECF subfamily)